MAVRAALMINNMNPQLLLYLALFWAVVVSPACGKSTVFSVTPKNADGGGQFVFVVTNTAASNGLSFHVIITAKQGEVPAGCNGYLCVAKLTESPKSIGPMPPSFVAVWLHGKSDDIIIPLPPNHYGKKAYQPYTEQAIIKLLKPEAENILSASKQYPNLPG